MSKARRIRKTSVFTSGGKFPVLTLSYINTALSQSAFRIYKCYIIMCICWCKSVIFIYYLERFNFSLRLYRAFSECDLWTNLGVVETWSLRKLWDFDVLECHFGILGKIFQQSHYHLICSLCSSSINEDTFI
jgi:hypothetical protein